VQILISVAVVAVIAVAIAIALGGGDDSKTATTRTSTTAKGGPDPVDQLFTKIPASGLELGKPDAPATLEEFVDPQCPFCAQFSRNVLPTLLSNYVRPGKLKLVLRPLAFIGDDSVTAARAVVAAGQQDKAWPMLDEIYAHQGHENSGYVTDDFLREMGGLVSDLDVDAMLSAAKTDDAVTQALKDADARASQFKLDSTPSFLITVGSDKPRPLESSLEPGPFTASLDQALGGSQ
jgi:protein-disulfide isomerase